MASVLRLALIQSKFSATKSQTVSRVRELIKKAVDNKAQLICLPECFNSPYGIQYFAEYSEKVPGETSNMLSEAAKEHSVYLIGGSIPEEEDGKLYNTCLSYGPDGSLLAKFRKIHLFDINVPGGIKFTESAVLSPGNSFSSFNIGPWKIGLGICYDMRFEEVSKFYADQGCNLLVFPGAFNMTTGPMHWELLIRSRAVDHQCFTAACSPARDEEATYVAWGHSTICDPWAKIAAKAGTGEEIVYADLDLNAVRTCRESIPKLKQKRADVYNKQR